MICSIAGWNKTNYVYGDEIGIAKTKYLREAEPRRWTNLHGETRSKRRAFFRCSYCAVEFETDIESVKNNNTQSCGCYSRAVSSQLGRDHKYNTKTKKPCKDTGEKWINFYGKNRYSVTVSMRKSKYLGVYKTIEDAKAARDNYLRKNNELVVGAGLVPPLDYLSAREPNPVERIVYAKEDLVGRHGIAYLAEADKEHYIDSTGFQVSTRRALFKCTCGQRFITRIGAVVSGNTKSCGCLAKMVRCEPRVSLPISSTGHRYIYARKGAKACRYRVLISENGVLTGLGTFRSISEALNARDDFLLSTDSKKKIYLMDVRK
jgi:hypothetical protein